MTAHPNPPRSAELRRLGLTEGLIKQFLSLGYEEGNVRNDHELVIMQTWLKERHAFVRNELKSLMPAKPRVAQAGPPIMSHRGAPGSTSTSIYGERHG